MFSKLGNKKFIMAGSITLAVAFIGLIYFEWGKGGAAQINEIASINGHSIFLQDLRPLYEAIKENYKNTVTKDNARDVDKAIMSQALRMLIQKYVILQQAEKADVSVSDDEIMRNMIARKEFQTEDGKFNPQLYKNIPSYYKTQVENSIRDDLTSQLFQIRLADATKTSDVDLQIFFQEKYTTCKIRFVMVQVNEETNKTSLNSLLQGNSERAKSERIIDSFLKAVKQSGDFTGTASAMGLKVLTTDYFSFFSPIKKEGGQERFNNIEFQEVFINTFRLKPLQISDKISLNHGFVVLQLLGKTNPDRNKFYKELPTLRNEYDAQVRQNVLQDWYMNILGRSRIVNNMDRFFKKD